LNARNLPARVTRGAGSEQASSTTYEYSANGQLVKTTDAADTDGDGQAETTTMVYDGYDRLIQTIDAAHNRTEHSYDGNSNTLSTKLYGASGVIGIDNSVLLQDTNWQYCRDYRQRWCINRAL